jgi:hypothetical protein
MSDFQYVSEESSLLKPSQDSESEVEAAPRTDPGQVLSAPAGPGQSKVRAQAITQLQRSHGNQHVQRLVARSAAEEDTAGLAQAVDDRRGHGQPLADRTRDQMEPALKQDLSGVRVHTDAAADRLSRDFSAKAFTTGQDVFFRQGAYDPGSSSGDKLLAHELTHVVQQGNAPTKLAGKKMNVSEPGDAGELEADSVADSVASAATVSRQDDEETLGLTRIDRQDDEETLGLTRIDRAVEDDEEDTLQAKRVDRQGEEEEEPPVNLAAADRQGEEEEEPPVNLAAVDRQDQREDDLT